MPDMLVKLYTLPDLEPALAQQRAAGITIRRAIPPEKHIIIEWVEAHFGRRWSSEVEVAYSQQPAALFIATEGDQMIGFACYETTCKNFFGPTGVSEAARGRGTGRALLLAALHALHDLGYGYAIIGGAGPVAFYEKAVGAVAIDDSWPGIYAGMLRRPEDD